MLMVKLIKVPKCSSIFLDAKYSGKFQKTIDKFLINTKDYIESIQNKSKPHTCEIKSGELIYSGVNSNDRLTYLIYEEKYVVAGVIETRTPFNNLQYTFFRDLSGLKKKFL